ncbi:MAG: hypothetical protein ABR941_05875 [Thermoleophilia bacterium]
MAKAPDARPATRAGRGAPASGSPARRHTASGATTYRVERPRRAGPVAVAVKIVFTLVFAATAVLCAYRADVPRATPHDHIPAVIVTAGFAATGIVVAVLAVAGVAWVVRGARFADNVAFAVLWPIATVLMVIAAGASAVSQHYLRTGLVLAPAGVAAAAMMIAVAWVYNRAPRR